MKIDFFRDRYIRTAAIGFVLICLASLFVAFSIPSGENVLVVHFTNGGALDFFGTRLDVLGIVFSSYVVAIINGAISYFFYDRMRFFSYLISYFTVFVEVLILIVVGVILTVN